MAIRFIDSFDHYPTADLSRKWTSTGGSASIISGGRNGSRLELSGSGNDTLMKTLDSQATWVVGAAVMFSNVVTSSQFIAWRDTGTAHFELRITAAGVLTVARNGTIITPTSGTATGTTVLVADTWYFIEVRVTISDTGTWEVRLNGAVEIDGDGDTRNAANATANQLRLEPASGLIVYYDDLYVLDTSGGAPQNDFLGDSKVECLFPNGNGNSSQLDGSDGNQVDNYLLVDETDPDEDTTYVQSADTGDKDTYAYTNLASSSGTVYAVAPIPYLRKADAGSRRAASVARLSATEEDSSDKMVLDSYTYSPDYRPTKPGGGAWSITDVNDAEFGLKVTG